MRSLKIILLLIVFTNVLQAQPYKTGPEEKDFVAYLFTYFTGGDKGEAIRFAVSNDGYHYKALNGNNPILDAKQISSAGGVRDPHILRTEDGSTFYMVVTDMMASKGWDSNRAMVLLKSTDLVNWTSSIVNIQQKFPGQDSLMRVWAPQTIYDPATDKYMIYWSMKHGSQGKDIIYYAYANTDFTGITDEPKVLFVPENGLSCIDGDIILKNGTYHLFYKTEGHGNGIKVATSTSLTAGDWKEQTDYKQQTKQAVEGSSIFKLANEDKYILHYDVYRDRTYQFTESTDLNTFKNIDHEISMDFKPRHGCIIPITRQELNNLLNKWGKPEGINSIADNNPIFPGYYADPEVLYSNKTKKYYIYPTSDGFHEWGGYYFKAFSSTDLKNWKDEGVILDLKKDVSWAKENAWAPTIIEKKSWFGKYKYYYYFSAQKKIGVAVSKHPSTGFKDSGRPLIDFRPEGANRGQEIDPDVFRDPKTGKYYLYWGSGYLAVAELNKDMVSIKKNTVKVLTPRTFREGADIFYRNGKYYFLWSENDTRDENYRVRYAYSDSPTGPLTIPENNLILSKNTDIGIYGPGHHSVLQVHDKDEWYIVYHRFSRPNGIKMGRAAGYHREVCMDKLAFNADGTIQVVIPTL